MTEKPQSFFALAFEGPTVMRSCKTAIVVGAVLIAINQYDAFLGTVPFHWGKAVLSIVVPYCVATLGAVGAKKEQAPDS